MVVDEVKTYRSNGIRIEPDYTPDDEGVYLFNSEGWHDIEEIEDLIKALTSILQEIRHNKLIKNGDNESIGQEESIKQLEELRKRGEEE